MAAELSDDLLNSVGTSEVKRILVVDDLDEDRERLKHLICQHDPVSQVSLVATGREAEEHVSSHPVDCVLLDYRLDGEDGIDVMRQLKLIHPLLPVVMLTGQGSENVAAMSIKEGASDYVVKTTETETSLRTVIDNAIRRSRLQNEVAFQEFQRQQFLNILVHDIRSPLRNITVLGEFALSDLESGDIEQVKTTMAMQNKAARRACDLIDSLESFAISGEPVTLTAANLTDAVAGAIDNLAVFIAERAAHVEFDTLPTIMGCMPQLTQLFQNLIQNGLKYNVSEKPAIRIFSQDTEEDWVNIVVQDNGIGIPNAELENIFAPMKRLCGYSEYEGSGLGLAICQKVVERQQGSIHCTSEPGEGSQFHLRFPAVSAQPALRWNS